MYISIKLSSFLCVPLSTSLRTLLRTLLASSYLLVCLHAYAASTIQIQSASLQNIDNQLLTLVSARFTLSNRLEEALMRGIPLYFITEIEVVKPRWYWLNETSIEKKRSVRIAYNVLTKQFRVSTGTLQQYFTTLDEALSLVYQQRWTLDEAVALEKDETYRVAIRLQLDTLQFPKPLQINALNDDNWFLDSGWHYFSYSPNAALN